MKLSILVLSFAWAAATSAAESPPTQMPGSPPQIVRKPNAQDYYPEVARSLGQQGTVKVRLCYDQEGLVTASTLEQSSGFERLDRTALLMGRAYSIKPGVINGQPQPGCMVVPAEFLLAESAGPARRGEGESSMVHPPVPPLPPPPPPVRPIPLPDIPRAKLIPL
jgi:TonB family protein